MLVDLEKILSVPSVHIYWFNRRNVYQGCNKAYAIVSGLSSINDIVGKKNLELPIGIKDPISVAKWDETNLKIMESGEQQILEEAGMLMDGTKAIFISHKVPIKNSCGEVTGLLGISINITEQKLREFVLREETERAEVTLEYIIENLPEHIYWKDRRGVYLGSNDQQAKSFGLQCGSEVVGKTDFDLPWGKEKARILKENDMEVICSGISKTTEEPSIANGKSAIALSRKVPLKNKQGEIIGLIGISFDITERKAVEKLKAEKNIAEKISRVMGMVSGNIAHEIRTPLSIIAINVDGLQMELRNLKETKQKVKIQKFLDNIRLAIKIGSNIIDMLLIKLRNIFTMGKESIEFRSTAIKKCIDDVIKEYPFYDNERKFVVWNEKKNVDFTFNGSLLLTKHMLFNLMKNALNAIKESGSGKIYINLFSDKNFNYLIFRDTATGIPIKNMNSLFKEFESDNRDGSGLGLVFCKTTMLSYGGSIKCNSEEGKFAEFVLSFPPINQI